MSDYAYNFKQLGVHQDMHTARLSVLWPIMGDVGSSVDDQLASLNGLLFSWRARVSELKRLGWGRLAKPVKAQSVRNCLPTMALVDYPPVDVYYCRMSNLCPWCYARRISELYKTIKLNITKDDKLYAGRWRASFSMGNLSDPITSDFIKQQLIFMKDQLCKLVLANSKSSRGIYWTVNGEILKNNSTGHNFLSCSNNFIAITSRSENFDLVPPGYSAFGWSYPVEEHIKDSIYLAFKYPGNLIHGDAIATIELLKAREKLRLTGSSGIFRGNDGDKEEPATTVDSVG